MSCAVTMSCAETMTGLDSPPRVLVRPDGATIAYRAVPGNTPGIIFCGGCASDMSGTKAMSLDAACRRLGRAFVRFDYRGHGVSSGKFEEGTIGAWAADAIAVFDAATSGPQVVVGSSMGGWIMLLVALARPERVKGLVGLASAPDFTEDLLWARYGETERRALEDEGVWMEPSDYGEEPYVITRQLIEEGREHLLLRGPIAIDCPVRLIHGMRDRDVPHDQSMRLAAALSASDVSVTLVKDGDHRLSEPRDILRMIGTVETLCQEVS